MTIEDDLRRIVREEVRAALAEQLPQLKPAPAPRSIEALLSTEQVAKVCRAKPETVRGWCLNGRLVGRKAGHRWVVKREDLERFLVDRRAVARPLSPAAELDDLMHRARAGGHRR